MLRKKVIHFYLVLGLFAVYLINGLIAIPNNSVTYDEMDHWSYAKRVLMRKPEKVDLFNDATAMPVSAFNAIPRAVEQLFNPDLRKKDSGFSDIMHGRYITLIICLLTGFFIYRWSKDLFGETGAILSLFLFVFCPNLNGHGILLTTDAYAALFTVTVSYFFWKFIKRSGWKYFLAFSISLGMAQVAKYSLIHLFIIFGLVSLFVLLKRKTLLSGWKRNFARLAALSVIVLLLINAAYLFNKPGKKLNDLEVYSNTLSQLKSSFLGSIPLPLPLPYIQGLDITMYMNDLGPGDPRVSWQIYLLGEKRSGPGVGFWNYYLVVFIFKTPLSVLVLLLAAMLFLFLRKKRQGHPSTMLFIIGMIIYFLLVFGFSNNVQIGLRHAIMVYPLLYVLSGFIVTLPFVQIRSKVFIPLLALYSLVSYYIFFPNLLSYTNELIVNKRDAYKLIADSNIDFGQDEFIVEKYLKNNPDVQVAGAEPKKGKFVIGVNDYLDLDGSHKYAWIGKFNTTSRVGYAHLLINVTEEDLKN